MGDAALDALIIPGGESTTMALVAERSGLLEPLRDWIAGGRPVWVLAYSPDLILRCLTLSHTHTKGTCAGLILIAKDASRVKKDGQELLGGLDVSIIRNYFGTQVNSFQAKIAIDGLAEPFPAVFIRAPVISRVGEGVKVEREWGKISVSGNNTIFLV